ncbi:MAG TPA: ABC transporter permease subunit [Paracoccaceae bacterium]|nr:ABC transporter permease subunit [Paracoccaceae bacterium]
MSVTTAPPVRKFRIDMLWNDSRYRSTFLQIIALFAFFTLVIFLLDNVRGNLAALGKEFGFSFMAEVSSYDINQQPIEYTSRDSHSRAAVIGMINTLLVAVVGCFLATIFGVIAGVARLSKNWLIRKLMTVYIEGVRNIPVLIQILLLSALIVETLPQPRAFRGEDAQASMLFDAFAVTGRGIYFPAPVWLDGSWMVVAALIAGIVAAVAWGRRAAERQRETGERLPVLSVRIALILGLPTLAYFAAGMPIALDYPELKGFNFQGGIYARESYIALTLALAIYTGAFIAENVRAGIQAVSHGQTEAAFALGLRPNRTMQLIVLPQALRVIIPPMISQYLNLTKNSSLALLVGYMDATGTLGGITLNQTGKEFETLGLLMAFYLAVSLGIAAVMNLYNENVKLVERTSVSGMGVSFLGVIDRWTGKWEYLKKGDAKMHRTYGIRRELNLFVLFYIAALVLVLNYVFIERIVALESYLDMFFILGDRETIEAALANGVATVIPANQPAPFLYVLPERDMADALGYYLLATSEAEVTEATLREIAPELREIVYLRPSYYHWPLAVQIAGLGMILASFGALITCLFKNARFIDMASLDLLVFVYAILVGFPFGDVTDELGWGAIVAIGLIPRLAIIAYTAFGHRPNLTFFSRVRRA